MEVKTICVLGAGTMGSGIAQVAAQSGYDVVLRDMSDDLLVRGMGNIQRSLERLAKAGQLEAARIEPILSRIRATTDMAAAARAAQVVIEAAPEKLELKQSIFKELDQICTPETILASNTSGISITSIASATQHRGRVIGMHWFNPAPIMRLIEIVRGLETSDETVQAVQDLSTRLGKQAVVVQDSHGFIVTRVLTPFLLECWKMLEEGIATKEDIDTAIKLGLNHPMGPFELTDFIGLDVELSVCEDMRRVFGDKFVPPQRLRQLVESGYLGRKTGRGFYKYK
ncbi:MAG TPA: 3-hydroxyacyl-CoA dehydrogenase NAD-binding domain-containing protein [Dehalococcoidia bacterium]|nr:3-hydroxyacyl-CoA dehydrogenase NAD-binding domain-containing protein [Dehalococcoidia bacterium]